MNSSIHCIKSSSPREAPSGGEGGCASPIPPHLLAQGRRHTCPGLSLKQNVGPQPWLAAKQWGPRPLFDPGNGVPGSPASTCRDPDPHQASIAEGKRKASPKLGYSQKTRGLPMSSQASGVPALPKNARERSCENSGWVGSTLSNVRFLRPWAQPGCLTRVSTLFWFLSGTRRVLMA